MQPKQAHYMVVGFESFEQVLVLNSKDAAIMQDILARNSVYSRTGYGADRKYVPCSDAPNCTMVRADRIQFLEPSLAEAVSFALDDRR